MKCVLKIIAGLVVLIIIAAVVIPMLVPADYLKQQLVTQVKTATGRTLDIKGKVGIVSGGGSGHDAEKRGAVARLRRCPGSPSIRS